MKNPYINILLTFLIFCCFSFSSTAQNFEGIIHYEIPTQQNESFTDMSYMIKGNKSRMEFNKSGQKGAMLYFPEESKMVVLIDAQKAFISMDAADNKDMNDYSDVEAVKTGDTKTIAGKQCEVWKIDSKDNTVEACMAKGMGTFMMPKNPMGGDSTPQWAKELMDEGAMPLEVIEIEGGNRALMMRAKKIEEKSLSDDLYVIPDGYRDMSAMMRQMQQMRQN